MTHLDDEAEALDRAAFARRIHEARPPQRYPNQPWEQWDVGEIGGIGGDVVCLQTACRNSYFGWFRYLTPDALGMGTANVFALDAVRRLTPSEALAHPLTGPAIRAAAEAVSLNPDLHPAMAFQVWQEGWGP